MTLDDLLNRIARTGDISVTVRTMRHGNDGGVGDYPIVTIRAGSDEAEFTKTQDGWVNSTEQLTNQLADLHNALEDAGTKNDDWHFARHLEDVLGAQGGFHTQSQIQDAQELLRRNQRS